MGKYMFVVAPKATKKDVKRAVEGIYDVTVTNVHVIVKKPKTVSFRGFSGRRPAKKTAIVTLKKGQEITLVESA
jgi:large subunit ribosomal protein L23